MLTRVYAKRGRCESVIVRTELIKNLRNHLQNIKELISFWEPLKAFFISGVDGFYNGILRYCNSSGIERKLDLCTCSQCAVGITAASGARGAFPRASTVLEGRLWVAEVWWEGPRSRRGLWRAPRMRLGWRPPLPFTMGWRICAASMNPYLCPNISYVLRWLCSLPA